MNSFLNKDGKPVLLQMVKGIQENKDYLAEVDGLIGDGDHGMNMNKGFTVFEARFAAEDYSFTDGLEKLGTVLMNEIGGSMGPIYGTLFLEMADAGADSESIYVKGLADMLEAGLKGLYGLVDARVGDKTLIDTLSPAVKVLKEAAEKHCDFRTALAGMVSAANEGCRSTKDLAAKYGRSSRLGERSRGVPDAGATSCKILLSSMAEGILLSGSD